MATIKFRDLKAGILESLRPELAMHGFSLNVKHGRFLRRRGDVTDELQLQCRDGYPGCRVEPDVGVRFECVEEIFHRTSGFEHKNQKGTSTVGGSIGELSNRPSRRLEFFTEFEAGIPRVVQDVLKIFHEFAVPYFERYGSLRAIDNELNGDPRSMTHQRSLPWFRCSTGIIVAKLVARPDYEELASFYLDVMRNHKFYLKYFQPLLKSLEDVEPLREDEIANLTVQALPSIRRKENA